MIHRVFSVYDAAAKAYLPPFFLPATGMAIRTFSDAVNDPAHQFHRHASDYTLMEIGSFNDSIGVLTCETPVKVIGGLEVRMDVREAKEQVSFIDKKGELDASAISNGS